MSRLLVVGPAGLEIGTVIELKVALKMTMVHIVILPLLTTLAY